MPRTLWCDHHHIDIHGRNDRVEMNAETVRNAEYLARMQIGLDRFFVEFALGFVGSEQVNPVGALGCLVGRNHDHAIRPRLLRALASWIEANNHFEAAVAEILRLRVPLAAVTNNGDRLAL